MSTIRVFRSDDKVPKKKAKPKKRLPSSSKPQKSSKQTQQLPVKVAAQVVARPQRLETVRVKHQLVLTDKQKERLEALFMAPKALAALLRAYPKKLMSTDDASMFLLTSRKELDGYINPNVRGRSIDLLKNLLLLWSGNPPDAVAIDFEDVSLTLDHKIYLPLEGFRSVEVSNTTLLEQQRRNRRFQQPFTLFEEDNKFFIALTLEPRQVSQLARGTKSKVRETNPGPIQLKPGEPKPYISGMRNQPKEPRQRVLYSKYSGVFSGGLKTMNWGSLSGRGVSGGLPSLGKRSR